MKLYVQKVEAVLESTACMASGASTSGSLMCAGYAYLVGGLNANAAGSLIVEQSVDRGQTWDLVSSSAATSACTSASRQDAIIGNAVRVRYGVTANASLVRMFFGLRPI